MQSSTVEVIRSVLKTDVTITPSDRAEILELLRNGKPAPEQPANTGPRILRPKVAAEMLGRTPRSIHQLCQQGILTKVKFPGRVRSAGILESSLLAAISG
jgi:hypothetical protein